MQQWSQKNPKTNKQLDQTEMKHHFICKGMQNCPFWDVRRKWLSSKNITLEVTSVHTVLWCRGRDAEIGSSRFACFPVVFALVSHLISLRFFSCPESEGDNIALNPSIFCVAWFSSRLWAEEFLTLYVYKNCLSNDLTAVGACKH